MWSLNKIAAPKNTHAQNRTRTNLRLLVTDRLPLPFNAHPSFGRIYVSFSRIDLGSENTTIVLIRLVPLANSYPGLILELVLYCTESNPCRAYHRKRRWTVSG